jgi:hypothetical protein
MILNLEEEMEKQKKKKRSQYALDWRKKNPEKFKKIQKKAVTKYRLKNKEKHSQRSLDYYYKNKEKILQKMKEKRDREKKEKNNGK